MKMDRRTMLKTAAALSLCAAMPGCLSSGTGKPRRKAKRSIETDILVVGGGTAGVVAALQAAYGGCRTVLVEGGSQLGGTMTTGGVAFPGLFHVNGKQIIGGIGWNLVCETVAMNDDTLPDFSVPYGKSHWLHQVAFNPFLYAALAEEKCLAAGIGLRYYEWPVSVEKSSGGWTVRTFGKGEEYEIRCRQLVDCTGDAAVTALAGFARLREEETQPGSILFRFCGYDPEKLDYDLLGARYRAAVADGTLERGDVYSDIRLLLDKRNGLASSHVLGADSSTSEAHTAANIAGKASVLRILRFLRTLPGCEKARIESMQPETAVRETYRIDGCYRITCEDYAEGRRFDDAVCYSYYPIDLHDAHGVKPCHLEEGVVPTVPLRALIPAGSRDLVVAGRCVSSDRLANSALRVQASCMGMGQAAGAAAVLACRQGATPGEVPVEDIRALIREYGGIVP